MNIPKESITKDLDKLIIGTEGFEKQLTRAGFNQGHEWMFNVRELLYDLRQVNIRLAELLNSDASESSLLLKSFVEHFLYSYFLNY